MDDLDLVGSVPLFSFNRSGGSSVSDHSSFELGHFSFSRL